jgi:replicative DNA helicase
MSVFQYHAKKKLQDYTKEASWCKFPNEKIRAVAEREEKSFISLLFKHKDCIQDSISSGVKYDHFWYADTSDLYKIIARYFDTYKSVLTREQFKSEVDKLFNEDEVKIYFKNKYDEFIGVNVSHEDYQALKANIKIRLMQQKTCNSVHKYFKPILEGGDNVRQNIESYIRDVSSIKSLSGDPYTKTIGLKESINEVYKTIEDRREHPENYLGIRCGIKCLDDAFFGFLSGKYLVISGMPNGGKTSVMFNMAMNMALSGHGVVYVTIESEHIRASQRILCIYSGIDENRILRGGRGDNGLTDDVMFDLKKAADELCNLDNFSWIQTSQGTMSAKILEMVDQKRAFSKVDVVFVDYLDVVGKDKVVIGRPDLELAHVSQTLQSYGKVNDILMVTAQQLKNETVRKMQKAKDSFNALDAGVGDVSGSQMISADADYVLSILLDQNTRDRMYFRSSKVRFGRSLDKFAVSFDMNSGRLMDMPGGEGFDDISRSLEDDAIKDVEVEKVLSETDVFGSSNGDDLGNDTSESWVWGDD